MLLQNIRAGWLLAVVLVQIRFDDERQRNIGISLMSASAVLGFMLFC